MLLDTSGLLNLEHRSEPHHARAIALYQSARVRHTPSYVLAEYVPLAHIRRFPRPAMLAFLDGLMASSEIQITWVDEPLHREAMALLVARLDKSYSLCDAVSFVLMRRLDLTDVLTTDRHFEQEGFVRLLA
jgi:predicted nucleic acid-binding protein